MSDLAHLDTTPNSLIPPGHAPIKPPVSGVLARWLVAVGEEVAAGQALGEVQREERRSVITAPKAGRVTMLADAIEQPVSSSRIVALVDERPTPPPQEAKARRTKAATAKRAPDQATEPAAASKVAPAPTGAARKLLAAVATPPEQARTDEEPATEGDTAPVTQKATPARAAPPTAPAPTVAAVAPTSVVPATPAPPKALPAPSAKTTPPEPPRKERRSTIAPALEIEALAVEPPRPAPRSRVPKKRTRIVKKTMNLTNVQIERWGQLMQRLADDGYDYSQAELERVAVELFLSLDYATLIEEAETNRDREAAGRYGWGNRPV